MIASYALREVLIATAVCGVLTGVSLMTFAPAAVLPVAAWAFVLCFFRDPNRRPDEEDAFLAPADGRVADITPVGPESPLGVEGVRIGIFMSVFDIHVNRSPCAGIVEEVTHHDGGFADARRPEAAQLNESATIRMTCTREGRSFPVVVRQVAGLIARRIVTDVRPSQTVPAGGRIGMIKFGSRVEMMVPDDLVDEICVQVGRTVRGGRTVLIRPPRRQGREVAG